jgi:hypothetical protein
MDIFLSYSPNDTLSTLSERLLGDKGLFTHPAG